MITYLGVLYLSNIDIDDLAYKDNMTDLIEIKQDIENYCNSFSINKPITIDEAMEIANYINYTGVNYEK